jgi:uncharacterized protein
LGRFSGFDRPQRLGINFEESDGSNVDPWTDADASKLLAFSADLYRPSRTGPLKVREFETLESLIYNRNGAARDSENVCGSILAVSANGELAIFAPEPLGLRQERWQSFAIASIDPVNRTVVFHDGRLLALKREIDAGVARCRGDCPYYTVCGGGRPVNKIFETGAFDASDTRECRLRVQMLTRVVLGRLSPVGSLA